ncbi:hypothetical protein CLU99_2315 [Flavobacterium sp. 2]|nr:hypothetical protein CLU99_2315 [Flavobacterium sp. 2]
MSYKKSLTHKIVLILGYYDIIMNDVLQLK